MNLPLTLSFIAVIPARRASTRLPNKPLADIAGKPMVVRVAERAQQSGASRVLIATDDTEIRDICAAHGHESILTRNDHPSGTDRLGEIVVKLNLDDEAIIVNVQGDEPLIPPALITRCAQELAAAPDCAIATASHPIHQQADLFNPNVVKVVTDAKGRALYFSRAPIPWERDTFGMTPAPSPITESFVIKAQRHVGLYAYRAAFLRCYPTLVQAPMEKMEALEQLRALWHGYRIIVFETAEAPAAGVDTPEDLERVRAFFKPAS